jgi:hypothetical protein
VQPLLGVQLQSFGMSADYVNVRARS